MLDQNKTYADEGSQQVWVSQPSSGLDKRQAKGEQKIKPAIIFIGKGNVSLGEMAKYDNHVDVCFQPCGWMDATANVEWVSGTLSSGIASKDKKNVLFADNASFQLLQEFHKICREKANTVVYLLPESQTDKVHSVDAGFGVQIKLKIRSALNKWLGNEENLEKWHDKVTRAS